MTTHTNLKTLNSRQQEAIKHDKGPLLIIAGAGTGKTTVITERIKHLILDKKVEPKSILALTFTEKASREMEERVDIAMPYGYWDMWISTFHSFCERILRAQALHIGYDPSFKLMSQPETIAFVKKNLFKFELNYFRPLGNPNKFILGLVQHFSRLQDEDITPSQYIDWVSTKFQVPCSKKTNGLTQPNNSQTSEVRIEQDKWHELSESYNTYERLKIEERVMDFGDVITKTLKLFRERPNILSMYRSQFAQILVDEFQDTNVAQYELLKLLAPPNINPNITVVGDDSQSIYKFRGAAISNILHFMDDFPTSKTVVLTKNYRSTQVILDAAYKLIQHNNPDTLESRLGIEKNLVSIKSPKDWDKIEFIHTSRGDVEAGEVAKEIQKLISKGNKQSLLLHNKPSAISYSDIAVLVRANNHADGFIKAFKRHGIPYRFYGPTSLFDQKEVSSLISYLKILKDPYDDKAWFDVLTNPFIGVSVADMTFLFSQISRKNIYLFDIFQGLDEYEKLNEETKEKIKYVLTLHSQHTSELNDKSAGELLFSFVTRMKVLENFLTDNSVESLNKAQNITSFFEKISVLETQNKDFGVFAVLEWIDLITELGETPLLSQSDSTNENAVNIMTVHGAKGLEFPVVFLVNLVSDRFPSRNRSEQIPIPDELIKEVLPKGDFHIQEERRLFYVGVTRAKDKLYLTASNFYGDGVREKKLSPFIFESLGEGVIGSETYSTKALKTKQLDIQDFEKAKPSAMSHKLSTNFHIDYLSYSQIDCFDMCPMHYKLRYIIKLPSPPSAAQSFGISMHDTLKDIYMHAKSGEKISDKKAIEVLHKNWRREGYVSRDHLRETQEAGERYILNYLEMHFDKNLLPEVLEQPFTVSLPPKKGERQLKIGGKIDRIDQFSDGRIEIIDYKTGSSIPTQKEVDQDMQLTFYALACTLIPDFPFTKAAKDITLSLYYFDGDQKLSTTRTKEQLDEAIDKIYEKRHEIEESDFECNGNYFCENCEYKQFCKSIN